MPRKRSGGNGWVKKLKEEKFDFILEHTEQLSFFSFYNYTLRYLLFLFLMCPKPAYYKTCYFMFDESLFGICIKFNEIIPLKHSP